MSRREKTPVPGDPLQQPAGSPAPGSDSRPADPVAWFAIWTRSRHEQIVRDQLERKGVEAFLPTVPRWSRWKDRKKKIDWPLFPGYCFARFAPLERLPILKCSGVVSIVSFDGEPAPIPEREINGIRQLVESDLQYDPCPLIREGMMVEVAHGPLRGVVGRLVRKGSHARLILSVDLIGQAVSVEVDAADVRPF
jgi:transcription antitermination factor NusG